MKDVKNVASRIAALLQEAGVDRYDQTKNVFGEVRRLMKLRPPKTRTTRSGPKVISSRELQALLLAAHEASDEIGLLVSTLYKAALRTRELVRLDVVDLRQGERTLIVRGQGNRAAREVVIPSDLARLLRLHVGERAAGPIFFSKRGGRFSVRRVQQLTQQLAERAALETAVTPDVLRRSRLAHLRQVGMDEESLRSYVG